MKTQHKANQIHWQPNNISKNIYEFSAKGFKYSKLRITMHFKYSSLQIELPQKKPYQWYIKTKDKNSLQIISPQQDSWPNT